jgi:flagellar biosynthesis component FlhA
VDAGEGVGAEVLVAGRVIVLLAVVPGVAGVVLLLLTMVLLLLAAAAKHLVKEPAKLGTGEAQQGQEHK